MNSSIILKENKIEMPKFCLEIVIGIMYFIGPCVFRIGKVLHGNLGSMEILQFSLHNSFT